MNSRVTLGLLAVLLVLAGVTYATSRPGAPGATPTPTPNMAVFTFTQNDVKTLKVEYNAKSVTVEQNADNTWKLADPPAQYSDSTHIAGVVASLARLQKDRDVDMGSNSPATFGLDNPHLRAIVTLKDGSQQTLVVGNKNPGGSGYYAQVEGKPGLMVVPMMGVDSMAQLVAQPPVATPTPISTPLVLPSPGAPTPTPTPAGP